jgi:membrane carboxypeptidase/penicillin-binding protein
MKETLNNSSKAGSRIMNFISNIFYAAAAAAIICALFLAALIAYVVKVNAGLPEISEIKNMSARGGIALAYSEMPQFLSKALVCAFDPAYFSHKGVTADNVKCGVLKIYNGLDIEFSDKTITQNLAAVALNSKNASVTGKTLPARAAAYLKESLLAYKMESKIRSKDKILEIFLNNAPFGEGINGLLQASVVYFNKKPSDLCEAECLTLAAILKTRPNLGAGTGVKELALEREKIICTLVERGLIDREKASGYKFSDFELNSCQSRINKMIEENCILISL